MICNFQDCNRDKLHARGLCGKHYRRIQRDGLKPLPKKTCLACERKHWAKNYCKKHYYQVQKHGEVQPDTTKRERALAARNMRKRTSGWRWNREATTPANNLERAKFRYALRQQILERDEFTCQICQQQGGNLHIDHIKAWSQYPELRYEIDNCRTVCMACHYFITFKRKIPTGITWGHTQRRTI